MAGMQHSDPGALEAQHLVAMCSDAFDGHDTAAVLAALTTLVTITLDDTGVPIDVFVAQLRSSAAKLANMRKARSKG
jgi:hypothetical protein